MVSGNDRFAQLTRTDTDVVEIDGRFFITIGNRNFNSYANNRNGYASPEKARAAIKGKASRD